MGSVFYLIGVGLAAYAGYSDLQWYFIFVSSLIMALGYFIVRAPQIHSIVSAEGSMILPKLAITQIVVYSVITTPVYFFATFLS